MQITFNTETSDRNEGVALIALLTSLYGLDAGASTLSRMMYRGDPAQTHTGLLNDPEVLTPKDDGGVAAYAEAAGQTLAPASDAPAPPPPADVDSAGTPFDPEVHSSSKAKRADGTWRARRGTGKDDAPEVPAEAIAPPPPPPAPVAAATAPPPPPPPPPAPAAPGFDPGFRPLMMKVTAAQTAGTLTVTQVNQIVSTFGLTSLGQLAKAPGAEFLPMVEAEIDAAIAEAA